MGGPTVRIDICSVRLIIDNICLGAESVEHALRDGERTSIGAVQSYTDIFKRTGRNGDQIADIAVSPR